MSQRKIKVLVADDSRVSRLYLVHLLESDPELQVIGCVEDGQAAVEFVTHTRPDVVLMDLHMPHLDGFEATRRIMETQPVPIVICTATTSAQEAVSTFRLMEAGAVACVEKPVAREHGNFELLVTNLLQTVKLMSEVKVVRRWPRSRGAVIPPARAPESRPNGITIIGIGASTGGPPVLQTILSSLPKDFPGAVLIVQHIARGFLPGLVEWLDQTTGLSIHVASHGASLMPGHAYLAPDDFHLGLSPAGRISLSQQEPENGMRPAVAHLFRSLAQSSGRHSIGVLLTGMGKDGAAELKLLKDAGGVTIAQDRESSVVHGMPGEAIALGAASHVLPADSIADALISLVNRKRTTGKFEP